MVQIGAPAATLDTPIEHLTACHRRIEQRLDTLVHAAGHLQENRAAALEAISKSLQFMDRSGVQHTTDEEASVFPRLRKKLSGAELQFLETLEAQHAEAEEIYADLKELAGRLNQAGEIPADLVARYRETALRLRDLYGAHIRAEDETLNLLAKRSLDDDDLAQISQEMKDRRASRKF